MVSWRWSSGWWSTGAATSNWQSNAMVSQRTHNAAKRIVQVALGVALFTLAWHVVITAFAIPNYIVPTPTSVAQAFVKNWPVIAGHARFTLSAAALGLAVSTILAATLAISFSASRKFEQASLPVVLVFRSTPVAAVAPIMTLFLGRGISTSIAVVTIVAFFPL